MLEEHTSSPRSRIDRIAEIPTTVVLALVGGPNVESIRRCAGMRQNEDEPPSIATLETAVSRTPFTTANEVMQCNHLREGRCRRNRGSVPVRIAYRGLHATPFPAVHISTALVTPAQLRFQFSDPLFRRLRSRSVRHSAPTLDRAALSMAAAGSVFSPVLNAFSKFVRTFSPSSLVIVVSRAYLTIRRRTSFTSARRRAKRDARPLQHGIGDALARFRESEAAESWRREHGGPPGSARKAKP